MNTFTLFFFFVFGRVLVQLYVVIYYNIPWLLWMWFEKEGVETGYKVLLVEFFLAVLTNCVLNFYWTFLIVRQVYRTITRQGDKHFSGEDEEQETDVPKDHNNSEKAGKVEMAKILDANTTKSDQVDIEKGAQSSQK